MHTPQLLDRTQVATLLERRTLHSYWIGLKLQYTFADTCAPTRKRMYSHARARLTLARAHSQAQVHAHAHSHARAFARLTLAHSNARDRATTPPETPTHSGTPPLGSACTCSVFTCKYSRTFLNTTRVLGYECEVMFSHSRVSCKNLRDAL